MLALLRKQNIQNLILETKAVSVPDLARQFGVAEETIRRDLKDLEAQGIVERTHGGAVLKDNVGNSFNRTLMKNIMRESKRSMAHLAKPLIVNGLSLFADSSTTVLYAVRELRHLNLRLVTNSIDITNECSQYPNISLVSLGGTLNHTLRCFTGSACVENLDNFYFDTALVSCRTLSREAGLTDSDDEEARVKQKALGRSKKIIVMADYTKLDRVSFARVWDSSKIDTLITDKPLSREWKSFLNDHDIRYLYPNDDGETATPPPGGI